MAPAPSTAPVRPDSVFSAEIARESGQDVNKCFQCRKCASGCPVSDIADMTPSEVIHGIRLGLKDRVLAGSMIWYCASCVTCTTRCPHEVDIARVMEAARAIARRERVPAALPRVGIFYGAALVTLGFFGRLYELGLIMLLKLFTRDLTKDMKLGMRMLAKGKLKIVPPLSGMGRAWSILRAARMRERRAG